MGEFTKLFRKIGKAILNLKNLPSKLRKIRRGFKRKRKKPGKVPSFFEGFFNRRHAGWPEYVMFKVQIGVWLLSASVVVFVIFTAPEEIFIPLILVLAGYLLYLVPTQIKKAFKRDYPAYRALISMILIIVFVVFTFRYFLFGILKSSYMVPIILVIGLVLVVYAGFRVKYGRDYTYGTVQRTKGPKKAVKISYDIRSNVKPGLHFMETLIDVKTGDRVKVGVKRSMWELRGSEPTSILEKVKQ